MQGRAKRVHFTLASEARRGPEKEAAGVSSGPQPAEMGLSPVVCPVVSPTDLCAPISGRHDH